MRSKTHKLVQYLALPAFSTTMRHQTNAILTPVSDSTLLSYPTLHLYVSTYFLHQSKCFNSSRLLFNYHVPYTCRQTHTSLPSVSATSAYPRSVTCSIIHDPSYYLRSVCYKRVPAATDPDQVQISISILERVPVPADHDPCYSLTQTHRKI